MIEGSRFMAEGHLATGCEGEIDTNTSTHEESEKREKSETHMFRFSVYFLLEHVSTYRNNNMSRLLLACVWVRTAIS